MKSIFSEHLQSLIYSFDDTYKVIFSKVLQELPKWLSVECECDDNCGVTVHTFKRVHFHILLNVNGNDELLEERTTCLNCCFETLRDFLFELWSNSTFEIDFDMIDSIQMTAADDVLAHFEQKHAIELGYFELKLKLNELSDALESFIFLIKI